MKKSVLHPLWVIIIIGSAIGIGELVLKALTSPTKFSLIGDASLLIWGFLMFSGGLFSLSSYFFETKWKAFQALIWVYNTIIPIGGKVNAIIFGVIGILIGIASIFKVLMIYFLLVPFFLSSINFDNFSISSGLVL